MILVLQHAAIEGLGTLGEFFRNTEYGVEIIDLTHPSPSPDGDALFSSSDFSSCEGIIVLGGPMNVYEEEKFPFLRREDLFLKKALAEKIPTLGICLGAQLLAKATGAKVLPAPQEEIGWFKVRLTQAGEVDPLFKGMWSPLEVFQWHEDMFQVPQSAQLLATAEGCPNQAGRFSEYAWGFQFHPEMNFEMLKLWFEHYAPNHHQKDKIFWKYFDKQDRYLCQARMIYLNFARIIARAHKERCRQGSCCGRTAIVV